MIDVSAVIIKNNNENYNSMEIISLLTKSLVNLLNKSLNKINSAWWQNQVIEKLTLQQQSYAANLQSGAIEKLDLASLLRVTDQNWYEICGLLNINRDARNWLKEAQSIRNRWAHAPATGLPDDIVYRDIDTIERLLGAFGVESNTLDRISQLKKEALQKISLTDANTKASEVRAAGEGRFVPGDIVRLKADASRVGAVVAITKGESEDRYQVFHDGKVSIYYESQLDLVENNKKRTTVSPDKLHAAMSALQLLHPSTSHLYSLFSSRINFVPYQFRPVLKLINADRPRMLIADEVGVGKTIEAGLILKELQARREITSVLIICPKPLVAERKWQEEMKRFDERFEHLDSKTLRYCIDETHADGVWPQRYLRAIVPYSLFDESLLMGNKSKKQISLLDLDPPPAFDLVIIDEAHTIRNTDTWAYRVARYFCDNAESVVLLSATPIQMGNDDLFNLLHLIRPDVITCRQDFNSMAEPNPYINQAIEIARGAKEKWKPEAKSFLDKALNTAWGKGVLSADPRFQKIYEELLNDDKTPETRLSVTRQLEEIYTFSPFINRTRRRDIGNFTTRKPETVPIEFTPEQSALHKKLLSLIGSMLTYRHGDQNLIFMLSTLRRQIASCVFGLAPFLENMLGRHLSQIELSELDEENSQENFSDVFEEFKADVDALITQARNIKGPDPKLERFLKIIHEKQSLPNNKLLVFSGFRHTLSYLVERLNTEPVRFGLIHGDIPDDERRELRNRFSLSKEDPKALDVLLSSEVGCEGLDYQFCDAMVNYDLPWNPMRVEQRIGRIDRYGQKSATVVIYNFITPGTVDAEIYDKCLWRIGIFRQAIGGSEEVLGKLNREIKNIAENFNLTLEEQTSRFQQLADNEIRIVQEQAKLEEEQSKLFGLSQPQQDEAMVNKASSFWLRPKMLANLTGLYLQGLGATTVTSVFGEKPITSIQLGQEIRDKLLVNFKHLGANGEMAQSWMRWLKGNDPYITLTFDPKTASERRDIFFITPNHPLAQQAAHFINSTDQFQVNLRLLSDNLPIGRHPFAIYCWKKIGVKEDFTFQSVCKHEELNCCILEALESAEPLFESLHTITKENEDILEKNHYRLWLDARAEHIEQTQQQVKSRLDSLAITHNARISLLEEQRDNVTEHRIRRMRESQINAANREYEQHVEQLQRASNQADLLAEVVAFGVILIERKQP